VYQPIVYELIGPRKSTSESSNIGTLRSYVAGQCVYISSSDIIIVQYPKIIMTKDIKIHTGRVQNNKMANIFFAK